MINAVRDQRGLTGMSQAALGDALGVSRQTINSIETGKYDPSLPLAFAIAAVAMYVAAVVSAIAETLGLDLQASLAIIMFTGLIAAAAAFAVSVRRD